MDKTSRAYSIIEEIAKKELGFETIEQKNNDKDDFKEIHVLQAHNALEIAFDAGFRMCMESLR